MATARKEGPRPLTAKAIDQAIARHCRAAGVPPMSADLVFPDAKGRWEYAIDRMIKRRGAPWYTAHTLRRTAACILANAAGIHGAASIWHAAKRAGHTVEQCEADYAGRMTELVPDAKTFEDAAGFRDLAEQIAKGE